MIKHLQTHLRVSLPGLTTLFIVCCLLSASAFGQTAQLPRSIISAQDATTSAARTEINSFVKDQLAKVKTSVDQVAREALIQQATNAAASSSFLDVYATAINSEFLAQGFAAAPELRVRLNVAIVIAKVANKANGTQLEPAAEALVKDHNEAVALWGIKAMADIVPALLTSGGKSLQSPCSAIVDAVKFHTASEVIPEEAYRALIPNQKLVDTLKAATLQSYLQYPLSLLEYRASLFATALPPDPYGEPIGGAFFVNTKIWPLQSPAQQGHVTHLLLTFVKGLASQFAARPVELKSVINNLGQALQEVGNKTKSVGLQASAALLAKIGTGTPQVALDSLVQQVDDAVNAQFPEPKAALAGQP